MDADPMRELRKRHVVLDPIALFVVHQRASDCVNRREGIRRNREGLTQGGEGNIVGTSV